MKFYVTSTYYDGEDVLLEHYPWLKDFEYKDRLITVKSLEELMGLINKVEYNEINGGCGVILFSEHEKYDLKLRKWIGTGVPELEIYDGYRE